MKENAELMSSVVKWFFIKDQKQVEFPKTENLKIEQAYRDKKHTLKLRMSGKEYEIDFKNMQEYEVQNPATKYAVLRRDMLNGK